jgi:flagellar biosynthetic protein FliS
MLYDGMLKFMDLAVDGCEEDDMAKLGANLSKALDIVAYLQAVLRTDHAPDLSQSLDHTYTSWSLFLVQANMQKDADEMRRIRTQMQGLRDAWDEANRQMQVEDAEQKTQ